MRVLILISVYFLDYYVTQNNEEYDTIHAIKGHNNVSPAECGIRSRPHKCFEWHKTINQMIVEKSLANIKSGKNAKEGQFPWTVLIMSSIVADIEVYTGINPFPLMRNKAYRAKNYFIHRDFKIYDDIALIQLSSPIVETTTTSYYKTNAVCLPQKGIYNLNPEYALMPGWGFLDEGVPNRKQLQAAQILLYPTLNNSEDRFGDLMFSHQKENDSIGCYGDSGSPVIQYDDGSAVIIAIYTGLRNPKNGSLDCESGVQTYHRVSHYIDWIIEKINHG